MHCATESTVTSILQKEDSFLDISFLDIASLFDVDVFCEQDPLFTTIDLLESSDMMYGGLPTCDMISKDDVYREETHFFPSKRRKSERKEFEFIKDESSLLSRATTNEKILLTKPSREKEAVMPTTTTTTTSCSGSILSLLTPKQLEQQLKHTTNRLTDSMERSTNSRKRLNDQDNVQEYCLTSQGALNSSHSQFSNLFVRSSSVLSSQSRANLILSQSRVQLALFKNTSSHPPLSRND
jgi:hypothetical protein